MNVEELLEKNVSRMTDQQLLFVLHEIEQLETELGSRGPEPFIIVQKELAKRREVLK